MGTLVAVTAIHPSQTRAEDAIGRAFDEMERVVALLNRYDSASPLSYLNVEGAIDRPPPELAHVVSLSREYHELSGGAFDVTVQPLVDLFQTGEEPSDQAVLDVLERVDGSAVTVDPGSIALGGPGMGVTLDGIAKGYVVDVMAHMLRSSGVQDFLINAGGDIRTSGRREDGKVWRVAVQDPEEDDTLPDVLEVPARAVATSGGYEIYFDGERTRHHIVSGESGASPQACLSVTVIAPTALAADALATTVFVLGPERGMTFIDFLPECACLIIDETNRQVMSKRWRSVRLSE
jgi:thiamine biosynthesis lipoprotein